MKYYTVLLLSVFTLAGCKKETYKPIVDPANFAKSGIVTNRYYPVTPGKKYIYEGETLDGKERIEEKRLDEFKSIMGINCIVVNFRAYLNGTLIEEAWDWYAQANDGDLWYFGEAVDNYNEDGTLKDHSGSWEAGVDGALPGIIMLGNPRRGKKYREEYYPGHAEDEAQVISTGQQVTIDYGSFQNCITTKNWTRLEPNLNENKIYAPGIGLIKEINITDNTEITLIAIE